MASAEYAEVLASLYRLEAAKGMDFKLERVALALKNLGNPHERFATLHVAGTNGKGSVAAMLHAMFGAGGYRVGLYTSPHLVSFTERIRIGADEISEADVVALAREIHTAATLCGIELTFFEFVTVMAFLHFARQGVELAVVEVGLGGRLDATNVVTPEVAVITSIGLDHQEFLGDTLACVAAEKAGIIKARRPVVIGRVTEVVAEVLRRVATERGAPAYWAERDYVTSAAMPLTFEGFGRRLAAVELALRGAYQRDNAATAIAAALQVERRFPLSEAAMRRGLEEVRWPGRLEVVQDAPLVILDGAHNPDGMATLVRELPGLVGGRPIHLLFAVMRDKRWQPMVEAIGPLVRRVTVTAALPPRGESPEVLARAFQCYAPVQVVSEPRQAIEAVVQSAAADDVVVVAGSLFLIGAVYPHFLAQREQRGLFAVQGLALQP